MLSGYPSTQERFDDGKVCCETEELMMVEQEFELAPLISSWYSPFCNNTTDRLNSRPMHPLPWFIKNPLAIWTNSSGIERSGGAVPII